MKNRLSLRFSGTVRRSSGKHGSSGHSLGRFLSALDWPLVATVLLLCFFGLANLYSATSGTQHSGKFVQQLIWVALGFTIFSVVSLIDYRSFHRVAWLLLGTTIIAIISVRLLPVAFAPEINGSTRWLVLGPIRVQPSEPAKIAVILALARFLADHRTQKRTTWQGALPCLGLAIPILLIGSQPDLGSALMVLAIVGSVCFLLVRHVWPLYVAGALALSSLPLFWQVMEGYQKERVLALIDPGSVPLAKGWQTQQSILAVGSGQITGKGFGDATQNRFNFLPEHWTDFPFSVWAEEWGFVGSLALLMVFVLLILICVNAATRAADRFGAAICLGVAAMIFWQLVVNIAMVLGMAPVVGVTLPLISYGGSSMLTILLGLGLVSSVSMRRKWG